MNDETTEGIDLYVVWRGTAEGEAVETLDALFRLLETIEGQVEQPALVDIMSGSGSHLIAGVGRDTRAVLLRNAAEQGERYVTPDTGVPTTFDVVTYYAHRAHTELPAWMEVPKPTADAVIRSFALAPDELPGMVRWTAPS